MLDNTRLQAELQPGEMLEWTGMPSPWRVFSLWDLYLIPFSLLWGGFAIFWEASVISADAPLIFKLWGIPFVLVGLYFIFGRFLFSAWERRHTWYGLTNHRITILTTSFGHRVQSFYYSTLPEIETTIASSGRGTLLFGPRPSPFGGSRRVRTPGFYDIPDAHYVFDLISHHRRAS